MLRTVCNVQCWMNYRWCGHFSVCCHSGRQDTVRSKATQTNSMAKALHKRQFGSIVLYICSVVRFCTFLPCLSFVTVLFMALFAGLLPISFILLFDVFLCFSLPHSAIKCCSWYFSLFPALSGWLCTMSSTGWIIDDVVTSLCAAILGDRILAPPTIQNWI